MASPISNSECTIFLTNICYDFFLNWQTEKKLFWTNKKFVFFFNYVLTQTEKNFVDRIGESNWGRRLMNSLLDKRKNNYILTSF